MFASKALGVQVFQQYSAFANNITMGIAVYWLIVSPVVFLAELGGYLYPILGTEFIIITLMYRSCRRNAPI